MAITILFLAVLLASGVALGYLLTVWDLEKRNERLRDQYETLDRGYDALLHRINEAWDCRDAAIEALDTLQAKYDTLADARDDESDLDKRRVRFLTEATYATDYDSGEISSLQRFYVYELMQKIAAVVIDQAEHDEFASPESCKRELDECEARFEQRLAVFLELGEKELAANEQYLAETQARDAEVFKAEFLNQPEEESMSCPCDDPDCDAEYYPPYDLKDVDAVIVVLDEDELSYEERNGV